MFDFHFDILPTEPPDDGTLMQGAPGPRPTDNPALFASMINGLAKLGLKLTPAKAQSEFLVIDHVEDPPETRSAWPMNIGYIAAVTLRAEAGPRRF